MAAPILALAAAAAAAVLCAHSHAAPAAIGLHVGSAHVPHKPRQSNFNPGLYVRFGNGFTAGAYRNTIDRLSVYAGVTINLAGPLDITLGAISGYKREETDIKCRGRTFSRCYFVTGHTRHSIGPLVAPSVRLPTVGGVVPRVSALIGDSVALHFSIEVPL